MRSRRCGLALLALLAVLLASAAGLPDPDRSLKRSDAKKWKRIADVSRLKARSGARQFLEEASAVRARARRPPPPTAATAAAAADRCRCLLRPAAPQELVVPIEVDVILVGFEADGGYGYRLDGGRLLNMLSAHLGWFCPYSWETEEELGVCMHVNFQVMSSADNAAVSELGWKRGGKGRLAAVTLRRRRYVAASAAAANCAGSRKDGGSSSSSVLTQPGVSALRRAGEHAAAQAGGGHEGADDALAHGV